MRPAQFVSLHPFAIERTIRQEEVNMKLVPRLLLLVGLVLLFVPLAGAQTTTFHATLSGKNQNPPIDVPGHGTATFTLSSDGKSLTYRLRVTDVDSVSMAHIHIAPQGQEGPVAAWLYPSKPPAVVKEGKFTGVLATGTLTDASLAGPLQGKTIADLITEIKGGTAYVNVHTTAHPAGEIRGQIK
jgi:CHRD domain